MNNKLTLTANIICAITSLIVVFLSVTLVLHVNMDTVYVLLFASPVFSALFMYHLNAIDSQLAHRKHSRRSKLSA